MRSSAWCIAGATLKKQLHAGEERPDYEGRVCGSRFGYLRLFYQSNPGYAGGQYLFLRINPEKLDMSSEGNERYDVFASGNSNGQAGPKLHLSFQSQTSEPKRFWRVGYGLE